MIDPHRLGNAPPRQRRGPSGSAKNPSSYNEVNLDTTEYVMSTDESTEEPTTTEDAAPMCSDDVVQSLASNIPSGWFCKALFQGYSKTHSSHAECNCYDSVSQNQFETWTGVSADSCGLNGRTFLQQKETCGIDDTTHTDEFWYTYIGDGMCSVSGVDSFNCRFPEYVLQITCEAVSCSEAGYEHRSICETICNDASECIGYSMTPRWAEYEWENPSCKFHVAYNDPSSYLASITQSDISVAADDMQPVWNLDGSEWDVQCISSDITTTMDHTVFECWKRSSEACETFGSANELCFPYDDFPGRVCNNDDLGNEMYCYFDPDGDFQCGTSACLTQFYCQEGPFGTCLEFRSEDYGKIPRSNWRTSHNSAYTNDLNGFEAYCSDWNTNNGVFYGGVGCCADAGAVCTNDPSSSACGQCISSVMKSSTEMPIDPTVQPTPVPKDLNEQNDPYWYYQLKTEVEYQVDFDYTQPLLDIFDVDDIEIVSVIISFLSHEIVIKDCKATDGSWGVIKFGSDLCPEEESIKIKVHNKSTVEIFDEIHQCLITNDEEHYVFPMDNVFMNACGQYDTQNFYIYRNGHNAVLFVFSRTHGCIWLYRANEKDFCDKILPQLKGLKGWEIGVSVFQGIENLIDEFQAGPMLGGVKSKPIAFKPWFKAVAKIHVKHVFIPKVGYSELEEESS